MFCYYKVTHIENGNEVVGRLNKLSQYFQLSGIGASQLQWHATHNLIFRGKYKVEQISKGEYLEHGNKL